MATKQYAHTAVYTCESKTVLHRFVRQLINSTAWFTCTPHDFTVETSEVRANHRMNLTGITMTIKPTQRLP